jgi:hypothetical protein
MNANDLFNAVMQLDLTPIKTKLMHIASGEGWSLEKANAVEKEYRRFLCLMKLFPEEDTAPLVDVDTFWHYHILDTRKYAADCEKVFGCFLHHHPYVGMDGSEEDEQFRLDSGDRMRTLYEAVFGEAYPGSVDAPAQNASYCGGEFPPHKPARLGANLSAATAYCGGEFPPHKPARLGATLSAATAYCGGEFPPHKPARLGATIKAATAYCGGEFPPHKPAETRVALAA